MNIKNREQLLGLIAITAVALLVGDRLVRAPLMKAWSARSARIAKLKKEVNDGALLLDRERTIRSRWQNMETNTLPNQLSAAEGQVLKAFDRWSRASNVSISSIRPQWRRTADEFMTLECRADASGNLATLTQFLYEIEKDPLALKVEAIEIAARDNEGQQLTLGVQVSGLMLNPPPGS